MKKEIVLNSVKQDQVQDLLFNREIGWQEIIYDLINTEQLDPWDINITVLTDKYLEKIHQLEETDFFISSKVLFAAALLLRIKSEILLKKYIKSIDEILFEDKKSSKGIELDPNKFLGIDFDEEIPELISKSPMPRFRKVTLQELMDSLNKAIITENRRIKKEVVKHSAFIESSISLPKRKFSIKDKINEIYERLYGHLSKNESSKKVSFNEFIGEDKDERVISFSGLLHLDHQKKVWLDQEKHFEDFSIWLNDAYFESHPDHYADLKTDIEEQVQVQAQAQSINQEKKATRKRAEKINTNLNTNFENPLGNL